MHELYLSNILRGLAKKKIKNQSINYMLYLFRAHNVMRKNDSLNMINVLIKKLENTNPKLTKYGWLLVTFSQISSLLKLSGEGVSKFQNYFIKYEGKFSLKGLISISFFLNFSKNEDLECYKKFSSFFFRALDEMESNPKKPHKYISLLSYLFKRVELLEQDHLKRVLKKYSLFKEKITISERIKLIWIIPNNCSENTAKILRDFIEENSLLNEIENYFDEIPISRLIKIWFKCTILKIDKPKLISGIKLEFLKKKNLLDEDDLLYISSILERENLPEEEKKALSSTLKDVIFKKNELKMIKLQKYHQQTFFFLRLKKLELVSLAEIEKFFYESFFLSQEPNIFRLTINNMINLSRHNYKKMEKFIFWIFSQILVKGESMPSAKIYEILSNIKVYTDLNKDFLWSLNAHVNYKLQKFENPTENDYVQVNNKETLQNQAVEFYSLNMVKLFLDAEISNTQPNQKEFNEIFAWLLSFITRKDLKELLAMIPWEPFYISHMSLQNKHKLIKILDEDFNVFYTDEKKMLIFYFYGLSAKLDSKFVKELKELVSNFSIYEFCKFLHIFLKNPKQFHVSVIEKKILSKNLSFLEIDALLNNLNHGIELNNLYFQNIEAGVLNNNEEIVKFYPIPTLIKIFQNKKLFDDKFLEKIRSKILAGEFATTEKGMNKLLEVWN